MGVEYHVNISFTINASDVSKYQPESDTCRAGAAPRCVLVKVGAWQTIIYYIIIIYTSDIALTFGHPLSSLLVQVVQTS